MLLVLQGLIIDVVSPQTSVSASNGHRIIRPRSRCQKVTSPADRRIIGVCHLGNMFLPAITSTNGLEGRQVSIRRKLRVLT